jgi:transposase InsO family protein
VAMNLKFLFYKLTGTPKILQSDNGKEFYNSHIKKLCENFKIVQKHSKPRHPQVNEQIKKVGSPPTFLPSPQNTFKKSMKFLKYKNKSFFFLRG